LEIAMSKLGMRRGDNARLKHSARGLGMLPARRIGSARSFDVHDNTTGEVVIRNVNAVEVVTTYAPSLTPEEVISGVAAWSYVDSDGVRISAHMSIGT
jgi:hypothetical protein